MERFDKCIILKICTHIIITIAIYTNILQCSNVNVCVWVDSYSVNVSFCLQGDRGQVGMKGALGIQGAIGLSGQPGQAGESGQPVSVVQT